MIRSVVILSLAGLGFMEPAQAFWPRGQVSHCADATTPAERARHRCDELRAYADPGWPALGNGVPVYGDRHKGSGALRGPRAPVRRLG